MKKLILCMVCLLFLVKAEAQSLSAKELVNLAGMADQSDFLKHRSFALLGSGVSEKGLAQNFFKNTGRPDSESIFITTEMISYTTKSKAFINTLLKQLQHQYKQTNSDEDAQYSYYQFTAGGGQTVSLNVSKSTSNYNSVTILQKK